MKKTIMMISAMIFVIHFSIIILDQFTESGFRYTYPYFHQSWKMFVPPPEANYKVIAVFGNGKTRSISDEILRAERSFPGFGKEGRVLCLFNCLHYFDKSTCTTGQHERLTSAENRNIKLIRKVVEAYLNERSETKPLERIIIWIKPLKSEEKSRIFYS